MTTYCSTYEPGNGKKGSENGYGGTVFQNYDAREQKILNKIVAGIRNCKVRDSSRGWPQLIQLLVKVTTC